MDVVALLFYKIYSVTIYDFFFLVYHIIVNKRLSTLQSAGLRPGVATEVTAAVLDPASQLDYTLHNPRETSTFHHSSVPIR